MTGNDERTLGQLRTGFEEFSRYDFQLALIPLAFLSGAVGIEAFALSTQTGLTLAGAVSLLVLVDALFIDPPTGPDTGAS